MSEFDLLLKQHSNRLRKRKRGLHDYTRIGIIYNIFKKLADSYIKGSYVDVPQTYFRKREIMGYGLTPEYRTRNNQILELLENKNLIKKLTREQVIKENPRYLFNESRFEKHRTIVYYYRITEKGLDYYNILKEIIENEFEIKQNQQEKEQEE